MARILTKDEYISKLFFYSNLRQKNGHSPEYKETMSVLDFFAYENYLFSRGLYDAKVAIRDCYQTAKEQGNDGIVKICRKHLHFA